MRYFRWDFKASILRLNYDTSLKNQKYSFCLHRIIEAPKLIKRKNLSQEANPTRLQRMRQ